MELTELVAEYGIFALGWVMYLGEKRGHDKTRDKLMDTLVAETAAKGVLSASVEKLADMVQARLA